jgi:hypothetical protein
MIGSQGEIDPRLRDKLELLRPTLPRDPGLASQARKEFLAEAKSLQPRVSAGHGGRHAGWMNRFKIVYKEKTAMLHPKQRTAFTILASLAAALVFLFGGAGMTAYAAQSALPGDRLYSVKIAVEEAQVSLSRDTASDAQLYLEFAERRLDEMAELIAAGRLEGLGVAADRFQHDLQQSISGLRTLAAGDPAQGAALVSASADTLMRYGQILTSLLETAPQPAQLALKQAIQASQDSLGTWKVEFRGVVEAVGDFWIIDGKTVAITVQTEIKDGVGLGDLVKVEAVRAEDGSLTAIEIERAEDAASSVEAEVEFAGRVELMGAAAWTVEGWLVAITPQTEIKGEISLGDPVKVEALRAADGTLTAREISPLSDDDTDDSDDDDGDDDDDGSQAEVKFTGEVQEKQDGYWVIDGRMVSITGETEIEGTIKQGDLVKVEAHESEDGSLIAHEIELVDDDDDDDVDDTDDDDDLDDIDTNDIDDDDLDDLDDDDQYEDDDDDQYEDNDDDQNVEDDSDDQDDHDGKGGSDDQDDDDSSGQSGSGSDSDDDDDHDDDHDDGDEDDDDDDDDDGDDDD